VPELLSAIRRMVGLAGRQDSRCTWQLQAEWRKTAMLMSTLLSLYRIGYRAHIVLRRKVSIRVKNRACVPVELHRARNSEASTCSQHARSLAPRSRVQGHSSSSASLSPHHIKMFHKIDNVTQVRRSSVIDYSTTCCFSSPRHR
jgi:hypothetical protein